MNRKKIKPVKKTNLSEKVKELIGNISQLTEQKVLVCHPFVMLNSALDSESRRTDFNEEESIELDELKKRVEVVRMGANARMEDLEVMPTPVPEKKREECDRLVQGEHSTFYFPFYMQLPELLVRENILGYLTDPQDKLNMMTAIPSEGTLMNWDENSIRLEMIFQCLLKQELLDDEDIFQLSMVNAHMRDVVKKAFERSILGNYLIDLDYYEMGLNELPDKFPSTEQVGGLNSEQFRFNPIPARVCLSVREKDIVSNGLHEEMALLKQYGPRIWDIEISLSISPLDQLHLIASYLHLMPNLGKISFNNWYDDGDYADNEWSTIEETQVPDLRFLKVLSLINCRLTPGFRLVATKLLEKYSKMIRNLNIIGPQGLTVPGDTDRLFAPNLMSLSVEDYSSIDMCLAWLSMFRDSPMTHFYLGYPWRKNRQPLLVPVMASLCKFFGKSLESLCLDLDLMCGHDDFPSVWMTEAEMQFSKLKSVSLTSYGGRHEDTSLISLLPVLEKLLCKCLSTLDLDRCF